MLFQATGVVVKWRFSGKTQRVGIEYFHSETALFIVSGGEDVRIN